MFDPTGETIPSLLMRNIPRDMILGIDEALTVGAQRAYSATKGMDKGHLPSVVGQLRHFHINETFHRTLDACNANPTPLRGNNIVTGRSGVFTLARFNIKEGIWVNGRRSKTRRQMSLANAAIEPLVQPELFSKYTAPSQAVAFFVACFAPSLLTSPDLPVSIHIAVPDRYMEGWLFRESLQKFINRYEQQPVVVQDDFALPTLKKGISKQDKDGTIA